MKVVLLSWLYAAVTVIIVTTIITQAGIAAGATTEGSHGFPIMAITPFAYIPVTIITMLLGAVGWKLIARKAKNAKRILLIIAVAVFLVSLLPVFTSGATTTTLVTLVIVHLFSALIAVLVFSRVMKW